MGIALSLRQVNDYYEHFFCKAPPIGSSYCWRMSTLVKEIGVKKLEERRIQEYEQKYFQQVIPITTSES